MPFTHHMRPLPETYDTAATEKKWQDTWVNQKIYAWDEARAYANARTDSFVIDTPPPTVSGQLHMGHVFSYTQADFIARFQRMTGKNVFYPMGFDDNGLPTERLVEKAKKIRATDMSREAFIAECLSVSEEARAEFRALFKSIALSVDWDQEYHTISDASRALSQASFLDMVKKGEVYRALRPFYWDPVDQTAIAQAEIVDKEMASFQNIILFEVDGVKVPVMTTRPELLPACVALMYHPDDDAKYKGKKARTPLFNVEVPMIADGKVDKEKGTGLVMCCTFGDDTDVQWWEEYKAAYQLPVHQILNKFGKMDLVGLRIALLRPEGKDDDADALIEKIRDKKVSNPDPKNLGAREIVLNLLKERGLLSGEPLPITRSVKCAERSGSPLEILLTEQWFVKVMDKKEELLKKTRNCNWNPEWMRVRMEQWINGLSQDWCISRQRYFGVPFPVWYARSTDGTTKKTVYATADELPINPLLSLPKEFKEIGKIIDATTQKQSGWQVEDRDGNQFYLHPDMDVMDTWATSSISPQLSAGAIHHDSRFTIHDSRFDKLFPADLRPQAHEIIRTWAFYTIVKAHIHNQSVPWHNLMISGWCLAEDKTKMSKSKGNVVTPVALIEEKGTDAVRYWAATSRLGQDTAFSPELLKIGKKLVGKLWNATQFAAIHLEKLDRTPDMHAITETLDRWIISRLHDTVARATAAFHAYEYADALDVTNQFFWSDFCDNYLELIKKRVYNEDGAFPTTRQQSAVHALYFCLQGILKLYAPIVPHVTEELYSHIFSDDFAKAGSLHACGMWPDAVTYRRDEAALSVGAHALAVLEEIRKAKSDAKVSIKYPVELVKLNWPGELDAVAISALEDIKAAGNVQKLSPETAEDLQVEVTLAAEADAA